MRLRPARSSPPACGALEPSPAAAGALRHFPPLHFVSWSKPSSNKQTVARTLKGKVLRKGTLEAQGRSHVTVSSRNWKNKQVVQIPGSAVLGLSCVIYLETKRHCPRSSLPVEIISPLLSFMARFEHRREARFPVSY